MTQIRVLIAVLAALVVAACSSEKPEEKRTAPTNINDSLKPANEVDPLVTDARGMIALKKKALGKAYLMSSTMTIAWSAPILDHLQPVVVSFERSGKELGLFELNTLNFYADLPAEKLLRTFQVHHETDTDIFFEWDYGLEYVSSRSLAVYTDMPDEMTESPLMPGENVTPTVTSFVRSISVENNVLHIAQVSRVREHNFTVALPNLVAGTPVTTNSADSTLTMDFRIRPYVPSKTFVPKASELKGGAGFFEQIGWNADAKELEVRAQRWDLSKDRGPVTYAITRNVPQDYANAVKEGVLYWNKVIGYEALRVEMGADPREQARDRRVLVHWIDWEDAGFARASLQADPLTGELISGNVYMTSVFAVGAKMSARQDSRTKIPFRFIKPAGIPASTVCALDFAGRFFDSLPDSLDEKTLLRAAQDQVRVTVAHEVGHTLGLRHNFAGSIGGNLSGYEQIRDVVKNYYKGALPTTKVTTTVMDYEGGSMGSLIGGLILAKTLDYDVQMMQWSMDPALKAKDIKDRAPLCTDGDIQNEDGSQKMIGCEAFDEGLEPLAYKAGKAYEARTNIAIRLARSMIAALRPLNPKAKKSPSDLLKALNAMNLDQRAAAIINAFDGLAEGFKAGAKHINTFRRLGNPGWMNEEQWKAANDEEMKKALAGVGGLSGALAKALPIGEDGQVQKGWLAAQVATALENPELKSGVTLEGVAYDLTNEERDVLAQILNAFAPVFETKYNAAVLAILTPADDAKVMFDGERLPEGDAAAIAKIGAALVAQSESTVKLHVGEKSIDAVKPSHPAAFRLQALKLLQPKIFGQDDWASAAREQLQKSLVERVKALGAEGANAAELTASLKKLSLDADAKKWTAEELALIAALDGAAE